jgi:hypothetical protein
VSASGEITVNTPRLFAEFAQGRDVRGAVVVLDSGGGMVGSGLALGRLFRRFAVTTTVGRTAKLPPAADGSERATLSPRGVCASMCVYAFLGGSRRGVPAEARVLVHQIWPGTKREDAVAATYSAGELVRLQRELGVIAKYIVEMGGDIALFETAMRIPPWEGPRPLNADEVRAAAVRRRRATGGGGGQAAGERDSGSRARLGHDRRRRGARARAQASDHHRRRPYRFVRTGTGLRRGRRQRHHRL